MKIDEIGVKLLESRWTPRVGIVFTVLAIIALLVAQTIKALS